MTKRKLKRIPAMLILLALSRIEKQLIPLIEVQEVEDGLKLLMSPTKEVIQVLSDKDPDDKEQLKKVWKEFLQSKDLELYEEANLQKLVDEVDDETLKKGLRLAIKPIVNIRRALTDDVKPNSEQLKSIFENILQDESVLDFIIEDLLKLLLVRYIKNEDAADFIMGLVEDARSITKEVMD